MKLIMTATAFMLTVLTSFNSFAQNSIAERDSLIQPYNLYVTYNKTTNLVFPYAIKSVDRGSSDILAQKVKDIENVLQVKAAKKRFDETNLTVITADGHLYSYILKYSDFPSVLNIQYALPATINPGILFSQSNGNNAKTQLSAEKVAAKRRTIYQLKDHKHGVDLSLNCLFIKDNVLYFQMGIGNRSNVDYEIDQLRFFVRDQKKSRRTASQELEIKPLYIHNYKTALLGDSQELFVFAVPKFTIPDRKYMVVELFEKNGGRNLQLKLGNRTIVNAKSL